MISEYNIVVGEPIEVGELIINSEPLTSIVEATNNFLHLNLSQPNVNPPHLVAVLAINYISLVFHQ